MDALHYHTITIALLIAAVTDIRSRRIPNAVTLPAMLIALALHGATQGWEGLLFSASGLALGFGVMLVPYLIGVMGAGDVKLMAAVGASLGSVGVLKAFLFTSLAGGAYALAVLALNLPALKAIGTSMKETSAVFAATGRLGYRSRTSGMALPSLAYGAAIAIGSILSILHGHGIAAFVPAGWM